MGFIVCLLGIGFLLNVLRSWWEGVLGWGYLGGEVGSDGLVWRVDWVEEVGV